MITIYTKTNAIRLIINDSDDSQTYQELSGEEYASIQFKSNILINFGVGDYIDVYSKRYWIMKTPAPIEKQSSIEYNYTIKFESSRAFLGYVNFELFDNTSISLVPEYNNATSYTTGNVVTYRNLFWQCTQNCTGITPAENDYWSIKSTITNYVPPYNASTTYTYGDIVEYNNNYFMYIYGDDASGNIPKEGDHWTIIKTAPQWDFSTVLTPSRYAQLIVDNMRRARPDQDWVVGDCVAKSPLQASFSNVSCLDAASQIAELFETELYVDGFTINFKKKEQSTNISMKYGENGGFQNITRSEVTESSKVTRLVALGGTQNLLSSYRNGSTRLMLPNRYYLDSDNIDLLFPIEKTVTWDEIFPCMSHATEDWDSTKTYYAGSQVTYNGYSWDALQQSINVTPITGAYWKISEGTITGFLSQYKFIDANLTFNPLDSQYIMADGTKPKVRFITGNLAGYDFPIAGYEPSTKTITIEQISDSKYSSLPTASYGMKQGDQYVFIDLYMPQSYVTKNENKLLASAQEYLSIYSRDQVSYSGDVDTIWATNNNINLHAGDLIHVIDEDFNINLEYRIVNVTRGLRNQYEYQITLSTLPRIATRIESIENKLNSVSSQTSNNTINNGLVNQAVSTKLDKSIWDSVFEIRSDQYLNKYLFGKLPIALQYDFTTFAIGDVILPTLYDGLPIDGTTLQWVGGVLKAVGGGGGLGTVTGVSVNGSTYSPVDGLITLPNYPSSLPASDVYALAKQANKPTYAWDEISNKPSWIGSTKPSYAWDEIGGKPTTFTPSAHTHSWSNIVSGKPTTLSGYGITDVNSYSPTLTGVGASGTWGINVTGTANGLSNYSGTDGRYIFKSGDTMTGILYNTTGVFALNSSSAMTLLSNRLRYDSAYGYIEIGPQNSSFCHIDSDKNFYFNRDLYVNNNLIWHSGNVGAGSGLDADLLDGYHYSDIINGNVSSATKLQTSRNIYGHPFDGTQDVISTFRSLLSDGANGVVAHSILNYNPAPYGLLTRIYNNGGVSLQSQRETTSSEYFDLYLNDFGGNVGIGTNAPSYKLHVVGTGYFSDVLSTGGNINAGIGLGINNTSSTSGYGLSLYGGAVTGKPTYGIMFTGTASYGTHGGVTGDRAMYFNIDSSPNRGWIFQRGSTNVASIDGNGNLLLNGDFTVFSDIRKKDIQRNIIYSIDQIAKAPLFEYTYKGNDILRVGTSANYWAGLSPAVRMSGDFYTLNESALALACSISLAKEFNIFLNKYETREEKQDKLIREQGKKIKNLEKRIKELEYGNI